MNSRHLLVLGVLSAGQIYALAQKEDSYSLQHMDLRQAVKLALKNNHEVRLSTLKIEKDKRAKEVVRSAYSPVLRNDSAFTHVTDTEFIGISPGALGVVSGSAIPSRT